MNIEIENTIRKLNPILYAQFNVDKIGYFGSFARNEETEESDIDIVVRFASRLDGHFLIYRQCLKKS